MSETPDSVLEAIDRAEQKFGIALRKWLMSEMCRSEYDFADTALAMHTVVAGVAARVAIESCSASNHDELRKWYTVLVSSVLEAQFLRLMGGLDGEALH